MVMKREWEAGSRAVRWVEKRSKGEAGCSFLCRITPHRLT